MASTITAADLKVKITEECILNGKDQGGTTELTIASIKDVSKRIVTIAADDDATVLVFKSTPKSSCVTVGALYKIKQFTLKPTS